MTLETLTKDERKEIQAIVEGLDNAAEEIRKSIAPQVHAIGAIEGIRDEFLMARGDLEVAGYCVGCECILFHGDRGYHYEDGEISCIDCSPTWADAEESFKAAAGDDEEHAEAYADFKSRMEEHVAGGGSVNEKIPYII
ncbi:hypothetical protein OCAR_5560 [Afipia carboxidovorans OM5]|uniref:Uncharacterized protein n=1 Tax=Afipia carboxidovorans (strain ATCC 49405 / DSM 1227 / KCTC 32145 / OM5) TaxID=504832 RepID=B6JEA2_AFIC5|nr:hypothetical protein [Afipia carboxidovorans]ACI92691.1 hypothetical protein OCAR_5560 [Afipia carboxidovorans OM5]AEI03555.1 hypothetical protein OCA4_c24350 [Afipia carboxidovorans OM4]AEI07132.1 hypothetical protein OCA5_c24360 [Afipia carboxidovorans OM5]BEV44713.1 hypothetical protein CRBSH125_08960 [Afipia carboxidovorans]